MDIITGEYWVQKSSDHIIQISDFYEGNVTVRSGSEYSQLLEMEFRRIFRHLDSSDIRHFHIVYKTDTGTGTLTLTSEGMFSLRSLVLNIETSLNVRNPNIMSWVELSQDDYEAFND